MSFISENWDKLVAVLLSTVIAGVIGFFQPLPRSGARSAALRLRSGTLQTLVNDSRESQRQEISRLNETWSKLNEKTYEVSRTSTESITAVHEIQGAIDIRVLNAINNQMSRVELVRAPR
jgi:hypothetical protein